MSDMCNILHTFCSLVPRLSPRSVYNIDLYPHVAYIILTFNLFAILFARASSKVNTIYESGNEAIHSVCSMKGDTTMYSVQCIYMHERRHYT